MKKLIRTCFAGAFVFTLCGCQNIQALKIDTSQKTFTAPSFYGKELPSAFLSKKNRLNVDNGNRFRGYHIGKRHWKF